jgi:hypothetical protein
MTLASPWPPTTPLQITSGSNTPGWKDRSPISLQGILFAAVDSLSI